jgi:hypothetical protein
MNIRGTNVAPLPRRNDVPSRDEPRVSLGSLPQPLPQLLILGLQRADLVLPLVHCRIRVGPDIANSVC